MMKAKRIHGFEPDYAVPPGATLREFIESKGMSQTELALRTGLTTVSISRILSGEQPISYETSNLLELVTGVSAQFWNNLEANYREQLSKLRSRDIQVKQIEWLKTIPTKELIKRKYIQEEKDKPDLLRGVFAFYGVGSIEAFNNLWKKPDVAARRSQCFESRPGPASAWLRIGEIEASKVQCAPYDRNTFKTVLGEIRSLTKGKPEVFVPELKALCTGAGVALVLVPEMKQVPWSGASKWLTHDKAMILLNLRGKGEDKFWFSLFHEASHILNDTKKSIRINDGSSSDPAEVGANEFAAEILIPRRKYDDRISSIRSRTEIIQMAEELDIAPGIVVGRYQFLTRKWDFFKDLIRRFEWA